MKSIKIIMKKSLLIAGFLLTGFIAYSQDKTAIKTKAFSIGPSGGLGHSFMYPYITRGMFLGSNLGVMSIYAPWEHWGIGLDVRYSMEGSKTRSLEGPRETDLDYVRVPIKGIYFFKHQEDDLRPKITLGPSLGFLARLDCDGCFGRDLFRPDPVPLPTSGCERRCVFSPLWKLRRAGCSRPQSFR